MEIVSAANHFFVVLSIYSTKSELTVIKTRSFKNLNPDNLLIDLNDVPWHTVKIMDNVEDSWHMWIFFCDIVNEEVAALRVTRDEYHTEANKNGNPNTSKPCLRIGQKI